MNIMKKITDDYKMTLYSHLLFLFLPFFFLTFNLSSESIYRRGARRWRKLYCANGHTFQAKRFNRVNLSLLNIDNLRNLGFSSLLLFLSKGVIRVT